LASSITGSSVTYATGGSAQSSTGGSATANTGDGGLVRRDNTGAFNGGSGVVVVRYPNNFKDAASTTGSPTFTNTGGYKIYKFTSSGTITF
jgi:hypothetical protein